MPHWIKRSRKDGEQKELDQSGATSANDVTGLKQILNNVDEAMRRETGIMSTQSYARGLAQDHRACLVSRDGLIVGIVTVPVRTIVLEFEMVHYYRSTRIGEDDIGGFVVYAETVPFLVEGHNVEPLGQLRRLP